MDKTVVERGGGQKAKKNVGFGHNFLRRNNVDHKSDIRYLSDWHQSKLTVCLLIFYHTSGHAQYILWSMDPDKGFSVMSEEKKIKIKSCLPNTVGVKTLFNSCMSGEKKKITEQQKTDCSTMLLTMINVYVFITIIRYVSQSCLAFLGRIYLNSSFSWCFWKGNQQKFPATCRRK